MVLRLSVPSAGGFRAVAVDLAAKVAEYVGCPPPETVKVTGLLESLAASVAPNGNASADITFEFHQVGEELRIEARCSDRSSDASLKLSGAAT